MDDVSVSYMQRRKTAWWHHSKNKLNINVITDMENGHHASCIFIQSCWYMWNFIIPIQTQRPTFSLQTTINTGGVRNEGSDSPRSGQNVGRKWSGMILNRITAVSGFGFLFQEKDDRCGPRASVCSVPLFVSLLVIGDRLQCFSTQQICFL